MESFDSIHSVVLHYETIMTWAIVGVVNIILVLPYVFSCRPGTKLCEAQYPSSAHTAFSLTVVPVFTVHDVHWIHIPSSSRFLIDGRAWIGWNRCYYVIYFREGNSVSVLVGGDALISTSGLDSHFLLLLGNGISAISIREVYWIA